MPCSHCTQLHDVASASRCWARSVRYDLYSHSVMWKPCKICFSKINFPKSVFQNWFFQNRFFQNRCFPKIGFSTPWSMVHVMVHNTYVQIYMVGCGGYCWWMGGEEKGLQVSCLTSKKKTYELVLWMQKEDLRVIFWFQQKRLTS